MSKIDNQLNELDLQKENLVTNLNSKGVEATSNETLNTLIPKILDIPSSSGQQEGLQELYDKAFAMLTDRTYNKKYDTDEQITLYTPDIGYQNYYISKASDGYRIIWSQKDTPPIQRDETTTNFVGTLCFIYDGIKWYDGNKPSKTNSPIYSDNVNYAYYSSYYQTIDECITAIKSNVTSYNLHSGGLFGSQILDGKNTSIVATNNIEIGLTLLVNENGRQLSSNENIVAIS